MPARRRLAIYLITNQHSGRVYVGATTRPSQRWYEHRRELRLGRHDNTKLQADWTREGETAFTFSIAEIVEPPADLLERELWWIGELQAFDPAFGYNSQTMGGGHPQTAETRARIAAYRTGRQHSPETRAKIAAALRRRRVAPS